LQKPIANFSFPFASLVNWFPESDVLKKRETIRQLVVSLQSQLNPDLKYDVQQGSVPPTPVMSETSVSGASASDMAVIDSCVSTTEDAAMLNTIATDADSGGLLQTGSEQFDVNEPKSSEESENHISIPMPLAENRVPGPFLTDIVKSASDVAGDVESVTAQTVATSTCVEGKNSLDMNSSATTEQLICLMSSFKNSETIVTAVSGGVSTGVSVCSSLMISSHCTNNHSIISSHGVREDSATERTDCVQSTSAEPAVLSAAVTGSVDCGVSSLCHVVSCAESSSSDCVVPSVDNSFVGGAELQNSSHEIQTGSTAYGTH